MIKHLWLALFILFFVACSDDDCTQTIEIPATFINGQQISPARTQEIPCDAEPISPPVPIGEIN
ncbi:MULTISPECIES: hypothetical protein [unclassified Croceitalea]|uniref:hypothetical protein n=1 Tax=unclassified Croceitalea TaxID=2632280 RepID=UPI0030D85A4D